MRTLDATPLNSDWHYKFAPNQRADFSASTVDGQSWIPLPMIDDWAVCASTQSGADWFRRTVEVEEVNKYLDYLLVITKVPEFVSLYVNGQHVSNIQASKGFCENVTQFMHSGENVIAMKLTCASHQGGGVFGDIRLQPVPRKLDGSPQAYMGY